MGGSDLINFGGSVSLGPPEGVTGLAHDTNRYAATSKRRPLSAFEINSYRK